MIQLVCTKLLAKQFTKEEIKETNGITSLPDIKKRVFYSWILFHQV